MMTMARWLVRRVRRAAYGGVWTWGAGCAAVGATAGMAGCVSVSTGGSGESGDTPRDFVSSREERIRIGAYTRIDAVAVSRRYVYAASGGGIAVYDRWQARWAPPLTRDGGLVDPQLTVLAGDPIEDALWIGVPGAVLIYRPDTDQLQRTMVVGVPDLIVFDRRETGDALVRTGGQWVRISRIGMTTPSAPPTPSMVMVPPTLDALVRQYPQLRTAPATWLTRSAPNRPLPRLAILSGSGVPDRMSEVWLGTDRFGLFRVDPVTLVSTPVPFGLREPGVGALAPALDGVWIAGLGLSDGVGVDGSSAEGGVTFAARDLQRWRWIDGTIATPLSGRRAVAMSARANRLWIAYDDMLVRLFTDGTQEVKGWTTLDGLADRRVQAVAPMGEGAFVATARGVQYVTDSVDSRSGARRADDRGNPNRRQQVGPLLLPEVQVGALQLVGDTLWAGTAAGLVGIAQPHGAATRLPAVLPSRRPVRALAWADSTLVVATGDGIWLLQPRRERSAIRGDLLSTPSIGAVLRVAIDAQAIAVAGTDGLLVQSRRTGAVRLLRVPQELPGPALDVVSQGGWWWVGTPQGLVRLARDGDGLPR